jgi:hypothetical protein
MKRLLILLALIFLVGCDYTVPLITTPDISIDRSILGLWQTTDDDGTPVQLAVLALDDNEYLVSYSTKKQQAMFARACLCHTDGNTLVQVKWLGAADGKPMFDNTIYQFFSYTVSGDKLTARLLNNDVVNKDAASTKELEKAIAANRDNPELFKKNNIVFTKATK